ncbi:MAG: MFS transporter [Porphyrobacter sp.]|nr:MFS transporter [Porphyrobacter sp.]
MASLAIPAAAESRATTAYQTMLVGLLGVNMGVVFLDRGAFGLLAPMIQPEFGLSNTQVGVITGALAVTWALSSFGLTRAADVTGRCKLLLVTATVVFSIASISSGLAIGFLTLLAARALMGVAEGGLPPLSTHIVQTEVAPERRGLAIGMLSTIGLNAIPLLGPVVIVGVGQWLGWREAFWVAGVPGLVMALVIFVLVRNPPAAEVRPDNSQGLGGAVVDILKIRNMRFTMALATCSMTCVIAFTGFLPLYLRNVLGLSPVMMSAVVTTGMAAAVLYGFIGPALSDRYGRRPVIAAFYVVTALGGALLIVSHGSLPLVFGGTILSAGWAGCSILIMNVISGESAPDRLRATAMGANAAIGETLGAGLMPVVIGAAADRVGLGVLPWIVIGAAALVCLITVPLQETAPKLVERRAG